MSKTKAQNKVGNNKRKLQVEANRLSVEGQIINIRTSHVSHCLDKARPCCTWNRIYEFKFSAPWLPSHWLSNPPIDSTTFERATCNKHR